MNHGNFNIQAFQENQRNLQNAFNNVVMPQQVQTEMPDFCAERIIDNQDDDQMVLLCNFTCREFLTIYEKVRPALEDAHTGGRNGYYTPATIFLITLIYLKNAMTFNSMQSQFGFTSTYMEMLIDQTVTICSRILADWGIRWIPMSENIQKRTLFRYFPQCIVAVDGSVQRIPRPKVNQESFYSGKHHFHCLKMQVAVGPQGLAVDIKGPFKGRVHDFTIFQQTDTKNKIINERNNYVLYNNPQNNLGPVSALFDKGYIGVENILPQSVLPIKKPRNQNFTPAQLNYNQKVSFDRIIVERWFGRLKTLWGIMFVPFPLKHEKYIKYYMMCAALTNFHIYQHPLTANDPVDPEIIEDE